MALFFLDEDDSRLAKMGDAVRGGQLRRARLQIPALGVLPGWNCRSDGATHRNSSGVRCGAESQAKSRVLVESLVWKWAAQLMNYFVM